MGMFDFLFSNNEDDNDTTELPDEVIRAVENMSPRDTRLATASLNAMKDKLNHLENNVNDMDIDDIKSELIGALENFDDAIQIIECYSDEDEEE